MIEMALGIVILIILLVLVLVFYKGYFSRQKAGEAFGIDKRIIKKNQLIRGVAASTVIFLLVLFFLMPISQPTIKRPLMSADIIFLEDLSISMGAEYPLGSPNRLERANEIVLRIVDTAPNLNVSLYGFTVVVRSLLGFTQNYEDLKKTIEEIVTIGTVPRDGTNLTHALARTIDVFPPNSQSKIIILLSDGEDRNTNFSASEFHEILERARRNSVKVVSIGIGEKEGAVIPIYENGKMIGLEGGRDKPVTTFLKENLLQEAALKTGGVYIREREASLVNQFLNDNLVRKEKEFSNPTREFGKYLLILSLVPLFFVIIKNW